MRLSLGWERPNPNPPLGPESGRAGFREVPEGVEGAGRRLRLLARRKERPKEKERRGGKGTRKPPTSGSLSLACWCACLPQGGALRGGGRRRAHEGLPAPGGLPGGGGAARGGAAHPHALVLPARQGERGGASRGGGLSGLGRG